MIEREKKFLLALLGITLLGFAARLVFLLVFDNAYSHEAEAYSKINLVSIWVEAGKPYPDINFGPLHTWLIWLLTYFFQDQVLPVRIFSLVCGALAIFIYGLLVKQVFDEKIGLTAAALLLAMPVHLRGAATSLALAPFILFLVCGLLFYFKYKGDRRKKFLWLALSALFLNMAGMLRFEAWLFLPLLCIFLLEKDFPKVFFKNPIRALFRKETLFAVAFAIMNLAFPLVHMAMCYKEAGHPLAFSQTSATSFLQYMPDMPLTYKLTGWFVSFGISMSLIAAAICALGLLYGLFAQKGFHFALLLFFNLSIFQYRTLTNTIDPSLTRYTAGMSLMLIPFGAMLIWAAVGRRRSQNAVKKIIGLAVIFLLSAQMLFFSILQAGKEGIPEDVKNTALFLRERPASKDFVMPDSRFHPYFMVESRLDSKQFISLRFSADRMTLDEKHLEELIEKPPPVFLILDYFLEGVDQVNSNLDAFEIERGKKETTIRGLHFSLLENYGDFYIYAATPAKPLEDDAAVLEGVENE